MGRFFVFVVGFALSPSLATYGADLGCEPASEAPGVALALVEAPSAAIESSEAFSRVELEALLQSLRRGTYTSKTVHRTPLEFGVVEFLESKSAADQASRSLFAPRGLRIKEIAKIYGMKKRTERNSLTGGDFEKGKIFSGRIANFTFQAKSFVSARSFDEGAVQWYDIHSWGAFQLELAPLGVSDELTAVNVGLAPAEIRKVLPEILSLAQQSGAGRVVLASQFEELLRANRFQVFFNRIEDARFFGQRLADLFRAHRFYGNRIPFSIDLGEGISLIPPSRSPRRLATLFATAIMAHGRDIDGLVAYLNEHSHREPGPAITPRPKPEALVGFSPESFFWQEGHAELQALLAGTLRSIDETASGFDMREGRDQHSRSQLMARIIKAEFERQKRAMLPDLDQRFASGLSTSLALGFENLQLGRDHNGKHFTVELAGHIFKSRALVSNFLTEREQWDWGAFSTEFIGNPRAESIYYSSVGIAIPLGALKDPLPWIVRQARIRGAQSLWVSSLETGFSSTVGADFAEPNDAIIFAREVGEYIRAHSLPVLPQPFTFKVAPGVSFSWRDGNTGVAASSTVNAIAEAVLGSYSSNSPIADFDLESVAAKLAAVERGYDTTTWLPKSRREAVRAMMLKPIR